VFEVTPRVGFGFMEDLPNTATRWQFGSP